MLGTVLRLDNAMRRSAMHPHGDLRSQRLGKRLFVEFGDGPWLLLHLGMTGILRDRPTQRSRAARAPLRPALRRP